MRPEKKYFDEEYQRELSRAQAIVLADYQGLSAESMNRLRATLRALPAEFLVVKNRLFRRSLRSSPFPGVSPFVEGQTAAVMGGDNFPELLKCRREFKDAEDALQRRGGMWEKSYMIRSGFSVWLNFLRVRSCLLGWWRGFRRLSPVWWGL